MMWYSGRKGTMKARQDHAACLDRNIRLPRTRRAPGGRCDEKNCWCNFFHNEKLQPLGPLQYGVTLVLAICTAIFPRCLHLPPSTIQIGGTTPHASLGRGKGPYRYADSKRHAFCNRETFCKQVILESCRLANGWYLEASVQGSHDDGQEAVENPFTEP